MPVKSQLVLGIMSGTSIDGVDYALCEVSDVRVRLRDLWSAGFSKSLRQRLHQAAKGEANSWEVSQLHHDLGRFYAKHAIRESVRSRIELVGLHGQTIFHNPDRRAPATFQLGEPAYLVEAMGVPVVNNFRSADIASGGQGAPLATIFHKRVFGVPGRHVCVNNLGGISNVTSIDWRTREARILSFDTGPANVLIDLAMRHFTKGREQSDKGGRLAARGEVNEHLLSLWLRHPFFRVRPPKSTGRELFGERFFDRAIAQCSRARMSREDTLATFTALTAQSLALNYRVHLPSAPDQVILAGGGVANRTLRSMIHLGMLGANDEVEVKTTEELGWPRNSIEPAAFALLAWLRLHGRPGNLPETTGARRPALLGQLSSPR